MPYFVSLKISSKRALDSASSCPFPVQRSTTERSKYGATFDKARSSIKYKKYKFLSLLGPSPFVSIGSKRRVNSFTFGPQLGFPQVSTQKKKKGAMELKIIFGKQNKTDKNKVDTKLFQKENKYRLQMQYSIHQLYPVLRLPSRRQLAHRCKLMLA